MCTDKLRQELHQVDFITVTVDASNMKEVKLVFIVVCYSPPETGVEVKQLEFKSVSGETAEILSKCMLSVLDQTRLKEKWIKFCANSFNTNFRGVKIGGQNNAFFKVKDNIKRDLLGIRCTVCFDVSNSGLFPMLSWLVQIPTQFQFHVNNYN